MESILGAGTFLLSTRDSNQAAVRSIIDVKSHSAQYASIIFRTAAFEFLDADPSHTIDVQWVPSHAKVMGNERADALANAGTRDTPYTITLLDKVSPPPPIIEAEICDGSKGLIT